MKALIDDTVKQFGGLDIVVNSAGVRTNGSITEITEKQWDRTIDVNLKGVFVVSRLAIPEMIKRGGGVILNIGARSGMAGQAGPRGVLRLEGWDDHFDRGDGDGLRAREN